MTVIKEKELMINPQPLDKWMELCGLNDSLFCERISFDSSNFSKMVRKREIPTSKTLLEKVCREAGLPLNVILGFDYRIPKEKSGEES